MAADLQSEASSMLITSPPKDEVSTLADELKSDPSLRGDPAKVKQLLLSKLLKLGDTIREVQEKNFAIEDDVLEKLRLLKNFNESLDHVNLQAQS